MGDATILGELRKRFVRIREIVQKVNSLSPTFDEFVHNINMVGNKYKVMQWDPLSKKLWVDEVARVRRKRFIKAIK